jgi:hypothetical protein
MSTSPRRSASTACSSSSSHMIAATRRRHSPTRSGCSASAIRSSSYSAWSGSTGGLLNHLGERIRAGENLVPGSLLSFDEWPHRITVEELPNPGEILFSANRHYQRPPEASVPAYQLTYDANQGRFPWDPGYSNSPALQPRPGTWRA